MPLTKVSRPDSGKENEPDKPENKEKGQGIISEKKLSEQIQGAALKLVQADDPFSTGDIAQEALKNAVFRAKLAESIRIFKGIATNQKQIKAFVDIKTDFLKALLASELKKLDKKRSDGSESIRA